MTNILQVKLEELGKKSAARLLMMWASNNIEESKRSIKELWNNGIFKMISCNPSSIIRFAQYMKSWNKTLDEITNPNYGQIQPLRSIVNASNNPNKLKLGEEEFWVIKESYEQLKLTHSDEMIILFILWQVPNGIFESDFKKIFKDIWPKWKEFLGLLMKQTKKGIVSNKEAKDGKSKG